MAETVAAKYDYMVKEQDGHVEITVRRPRMGLTVFLGVVAAVLLVILLERHFVVSLLVAVVAGVGIWRLSQSAKSKILIGPDTITAANRSFSIKDIRQVSYITHSGDISLNDVVLTYGTDNIRIVKGLKYNTTTAVIDALIRALNRYGHSFNAVGYRK